MDFKKYIADRDFYSAETANYPQYLLIGDGLLSIPLIIVDRNNLYVYISPFEFIQNGTICKMLKMQKVRCSQLETGKTYYLCVDVNTTSDNNPPRFYVLERILPGLLLIAELVILETDVKINYPQIVHYKGLRESAKEAFDTEVQGYLYYDKDNNVIIGEDVTLRYGIDVFKFERIHFKPILFPEIPADIIPNHLIIWDREFRQIPWSAFLANNITHEYARIPGFCDSITVTLRAYNRILHVHCVQQVNLNYGTFALWSETLSFPPHEIVFSLFGETSIKLKSRDNIVVGVSTTTAVHGGFIFRRFIVESPTSVSINYDTYYFAKDSFNIKYNFAIDDTKLYLIFRRTVGLTPYVEILKWDYMQFGAKTVKSYPGMEATDVYIWYDQELLHCFVYNESDQTLMHFILSASSLAEIKPPSVFIQPCYRPFPIVYKGKFMLAYQTSADSPLYFFDGFRIRTIDETPGNFQFGFQEGILLVCNPSTGKIYKVYFDKIIELPAPSGQEHLLRISALGAVWDTAKDTSTIPHKTRLVIISEKNLEIPNYLPVIGAVHASQNNPAFLPNKPMGHVVIGDPALLHEAELDIDKLYEYITQNADGSYTEVEIRGKLRVRPGTVFPRLKLSGGELITDRLRTTSVISNTQYSSNDQKTFQLLNTTLQAHGICPGTIIQRESSTQRVVAIDIINRRFTLDAPLGGSSSSPLNVRNDIVLENMTIRHPQSAGVITGDNLKIKNSEFLNDLIVSGGMIYATNSNFKYVSASNSHIGFYACNLENIQLLGTIPSYYIMQSFVGTSLTNTIRGSTKIENFNHPNNRFVWLGRDTPLQIYTSGIDNVTSISSYTHASTTTACGTYSKVYSERVAIGNTFEITASRIPPSTAYGIYMNIDAPYAYGLHLSSSPNDQTTGLFIRSNTGAIISGVTQGIYAYGSSYGGRFVAPNTGLYVSGLIAIETNATGTSAKGVSISVTGNSSYGIYANVSGAGTRGIHASAIGSDAYGAVLYGQYAGVYASGSSYGGIMVGNPGIYASGSVGIAAVATGDSAKGLSISVTGNSSHGVYVNVSGTAARGIQTSATGPTAYGAVHYGQYTGVYGSGGSYGGTMVGNTGIYGSGDSYGIVARGSTGIDVSGSVGIVAKGTTGIYASGTFPLVTQGDIFCTGNLNISGTQHKITGNNTYIYIPDTLSTYAISLSTKCSGGISVKTTFEPNETGKLKLFFAAAYNTNSMQYGLYCYYSTIRIYPTSEGSIINWTGADNGTICIDQGGHLYYRSIGRWYRVVANPV